MIGRAARAIVGHPWIVIAVWVVAIAAAAVFLLPSLGKVPQIGFDLPSGTDSVRAQSLLQKYFPEQSHPDTVAVVVADPGGLQSRDSQVAGRLATWFRQQSFTSSVAPAVPSRDGKALLIQVTLARGGDAASNGAAIERHLAGLDLPAGVQATAIGNPVVNEDLATSTGGSIGDSSGGGASGLLSPTRLVSLLLVLLVLALVLPLSARRDHAAADDLRFPPGRASASRVGPASTSPYRSAPSARPSCSRPYSAAGTNYGLFLISRYREELGAQRSPREALEVSLARVAEAILCSGLTVVVSMALMLAASFGFIRALAPVAIGVGVMLLAGLTLLPALMRVFGRALLWPTRPQAGSSQTATRGAWRHVGNVVTGHPILTAGIVAVILIPLAAVGFTSGVSFNSIASFPAGSETILGDNALTTHFAGNGSTITLVLQGKTDRTAVREAVQRTPGVVSISAPRTSGDVTQWTVAMRGSSESTQASNEVTAIENAARSADPQATVLSSGDATNTRDTEAVLDHDLLLVIVLIGATVLVLLAILLRSVVQPLYLVATTALSTAASIGIVALVYRALDVPVFWTVPIFALVFLVSLGQDFNILLVSRIKHEVQGHGRKEGIARAVGATGGVISSCGLVMVVSFATLIHLQFYLIQQVGATVVVGLLLDTFVVRPILVPALATLFWRRRRGQGDLPVSQVA